MPAANSDTNLNPSIDSQQKNVVADVKTINAKIPATGNSDDKVIALDKNDPVQIKVAQDLENQIKKLNGHDKQQSADEPSKTVRNTGAVVSSDFVEEQPIQVKAVQENHQPQTQVQTTEGKLSQQLQSQQPPQSQQSQLEQSQIQQLQPSQQSQQQHSSPAPLPENLQNLPGLLKILFQNQAISADQAQDLNNKYLATGESLENLLKKDQAISEVDLYKAKAAYNDIPFINVNQTGLAPEALDKVDESVAKRYKILPFALDQNQNILQVAMANPLDVQAISFVEQKTGLKLEAHYAVPSELQRIIAQRYAQDLSSDVTEALQDSSLIKQQKDLDVTERGGMVRAAPINKIVNTILDYALESRASDVHIEPQVQKTRVRYRIDGILQEKLVLPSSVHSAVVSRIKILSDLKIDEKRVPQDGRFDYKGKNQEVDLRVSTCPSIHGEKVVMRLLKKNASVPGLNDLGLGGLALSVVQKAIKIPHGIVLVTGPTGSGKTTSLYSILNIINTPKVNIMTLEDPVEYQMKGVTQVQTNPQAGLTFANGLRSFLRQDPDIIMVGEIRDAETAELAVQASLTGHLVFSTLHTNSAAGSLPRLMDMGVEPFLLSSSIIMAMGQRVVRLINPDYKEEYKPDQAVIEDIKQVLGPYFDKWCQDKNKKPEDITLFKAKEDRPQTEPEYKGRIGIFEVMDITDELKSLINNSANADTLEDAAMKNGMMLMKQDGYVKVLDGLTTIEEVLRVAEVK